MRFSIIIPIYNAEKFLRLTLLSVQEQSFGDFECLCVNDGSTDGSLAILSEFAPRDSRFKVIDKENGGEGSARNAGLDVAKGDWVLFLDADDLWRDSLLDDVSKTIEQQNPEMVAFQSEHFPENGQPDFSSKDGDCAGCDVYDIGSALPDVLADFGVWHFAYRRELIKTLRFRTYKNGADLVYVSEALSAAQKFVHIKKIEHGWRICASSMCHRSKSPAIVRDLIDYQVEMFTVFARSRKKIGDALGRRRVNGLIEGILPFVGTGEEWEPIEAHWFEALRDVRALSFLSLWQRFVLMALNFTQSRTLARVLCVWPYCLKRKGFHR